MNNRNYASEKFQPDDNGVEAGQYFSLKNDDGYEKDAKSGESSVDIPIAAGKQAIMTSGSIKGTKNYREILAWALVIMQFVFLSKTSSFTRQAYFGGKVQQSVADINSEILEMNRHPNEYYENRRMLALPNTPFYESPQIYPKDAGLVSRVWRSNGSPLINSDLHMGSCWCSADEWCMCTPSLAVDIILRSGEDHLWLVKRADTGLLALTGGFTEVGETSEESLHRELKEEMGLTLNTKPVLFGVYNDPKRDTRRHTTSVVYIADVPPNAIPQAGDDATNVIRLPIEEVDSHEFFIDHKTVIHDYIQMINNQKAVANGQPIPPVQLDNEPFKRSFCPY